MLCVGERQPWSLVPVFPTQAGFLTVSLEVPEEISSAEGEVTKRTRFVKAGKGVGWGAVQLNQDKA